ncbi:F-box domain containing protein, partial [Metarhizium hybridum]
MPPGGPLVPCALCSFTIGSYDTDPSGSVAWARQFRILYRGQAGVQISGVGFHDPSNPSDFKAPLNRECRWDNRGPHTAESVHIGVLGQAPVNRLHGFPLHEACWSLLDQTSCPQPVSLGRLFGLFESLTFPHENVFWLLNSGFQDGAFLHTNHKDHYPWEGHFEYLSKDSELWHIANQDPYRVSEIKRLLTKQKGRPQWASRAIPYRQPAANDCFALLPETLCLTIASLLPTVDVLRARQASRGFVSVYYNKHFWRSRFSATGERSWLFESQKWGPSLDWRSIYRRTTRRQCSPGLRNRARIMSLIQQVLEVLSSKWTEAPSSPTPYQGTAKWLEASANLNESILVAGLTKCCRQIQEIEASLPTAPYQLAFSTTRLDNVQYIAGIRIRRQSPDRDACLGFSTHGQEIYLDITETILGFNLAAGATGIQAIHCVLKNGKTLGWIGNPSDLPKTQRLVVSTSIKSIKAGFDSFKMASLAITEHSGPLSGEKTTGKVSLRHSAFWYPRMPYNGLNLNDDYFTAAESCNTRYRPLCWAEFGGRNGSHLRSVTGVSVTCFAAIRGIRFHYAIHTPRKMGRVGKYKAGPHDSVMHFSIDGPGGEIIDTIEVFLQLRSNDKMRMVYMGDVLVAFRASFIV